MTAIYSHCGLISLTFVKIGVRWFFLNIYQWNMLMMGSPVLTEFHLRMVNGHH
jgi:hypothetical protein